MHTDSPQNNLILYKHVGCQQLASRIISSVLSLGLRNIPLTHIILSHNNISSKQNWITILKNLTNLNVDTVRQPLYLVHHKGPSVSQIIEALFFDDQPIPWGSLLTFSTWTNIQFSNKITRYKVLALYSGLPPRPVMPWFAGFVAACNTNLAWLFINYAIR